MSKRFQTADAALAGAILIVVLVLGLLSPGSGGSSGVPRDAIAVTVDRVAPAQPVPDGFLGLSLEYGAIEAYAGSDPQALDPVFKQLVRNIAPGQRPSLRIGGDSADSTWWPLADITRPPGVKFSLDQRWLDVTRALAQALDARLLLGINLEAASQELASVEARKLVDGIGRGWIDGLELGNEPELYGAFEWYRTPDGKAVTGRPSGYGFADFEREFTNLAQVLPRVGLAGPTISGPSWGAHLDQFLHDEPLLTLVTMHRYPLQRCFIAPGSARFPSISNLLAPAATTGLANEFARYVALAHARELPLRIDELNTVSCGAARKVSGTFAAALWAADALFEMARAGVDGVDVHTFPGAGYELFRISSDSGRWRASVAPEYYGLMLFAQAAPKGSELLATSGASGRSVKVWATRSPDGAIRVVLINKGSRRRVVAVSLHGLGGTGTLERLTAPSLRAARGVTLGGRTFGSSTSTGRLDSLRVQHLDPSDGRYVVPMPPGSAALLVIR